MIAGPIAMSAPIQISAAWFPPQVCPFVFPKKLNVITGKNESHFHWSDVQRPWGRNSKLFFGYQNLQVGVSYLLGLTVRSVDDHLDVQEVRKDIELLLFIHGGASIVLTALILLYFPR